MRQKRRSVIFTTALVILAVFPSRLFPHGIRIEAPKDRPTPAFSLAVIDTAAIQTALVESLSTEPERYTFKTLTRDFLKDAGRIWSYPFHIKTRDILPIAGLAALTGFLIANDEAVFRNFKDYRDRNGWARAAGPIITQMGSWGAWGAAGFFLGVGLLTGDRKSTETAVLSVNAMLQSQIVVYFLKGLSGRQRPGTADGIDHWSGPVGFFKMFEGGNTRTYDSFPSGHAITAFSMATVVAMQYRDSVWVPIISYTVAAAVGLSRVTEEKHWFSDVVVGGVLGHVIGRMVMRNHRRRHHVMPAAGLDHGSLMFSVTLVR